MFSKFHLHAKSSTTRLLFRGLHTFRHPVHKRPKMDSFFSPRSISTSNSPILQRMLFSTYNPDPSLQSFRLVTRAIIGLNTAVFATTYFADVNQNVDLRKWLEKNTRLSVAAYRQGQLWTLVTSAFQHWNLFHFVFNMFAFNAFAGAMSFVPGIGGLRLAGLCLGSAIGSSASWLYENIQKKPAPRKGFPRGAYTSQDVFVSRSACGASGMVMGVGAAVTCLVPGIPMRMVFPLPVTLPMWALMSLYVGLDTYFLGDPTSIVGHSAHLGGAVFGAAYYFGFLRNYAGIWWPISRVLRL